MLDPLFPVSIECLTSPAAPTVISGGEYLAAFLESGRLVYKFAAGRGVLDAGLKAVAQELGLEDSVRFLGYVSPVQGPIEQSAAVLVPSLGEGFGMVALEAMERARPVIAADIGGLSDLVRHDRTGLLVPPAEAAPLAAALLELAQDPQRAAELGRAGRERMLERFPAERCTIRTELLYRALLNGDAA
jgi:glycosyltransferase involved in cell wall biosynthesis